VLLFGLTSVSVIERFETGGIEGENEGLAKTTQRVYLKRGLHEVDSLPIGVAGRFLEFIDEVKLAKHSHYT